MLCLESKLLGAAAWPSPTAPSRAQLVWHAQHLGQSGQARAVQVGCRTSSKLSNTSAAARPPPPLSSLERILILHTDSRAPHAAPEAYWSVTAAANALYAHMHGYDFVYAVLPESSRFRLSKGRLATWTRLVVVTAALKLGYAWVAALDSDTVVHQPYTPLPLLLSFAVRKAKLGSAEVAAIAMSNSWWSKEAPCAGNMAWRNAPLTHALLAAWWAYDAEGKYGPGGRYGIVGKREQSALWHLLGRNATLASAVRVAQARSLWCIEGNEGRRREGCGHHTGCAADYFFCHLPHYPHGETIRRPENVSLRAWGLRYEARQVEAAAVALGCRAGGPRSCRDARGAGFAVIKVTEQDLQHAAESLL